eukprot:TRINITY_DN3660_c0_g1_i7.p1 TRINITY_DN3660_c0_g1~~TRINITY_DN3660_c0_g1_i7.p1  ORF type:complete len:312 (+),score=44.46 TRINITY_DN3660_c0_g1_i7:498-1433(+)
MTLIMLCWGFPVLSSLPISWVFWIENILMGITTGCDLFVINSIKYVYYVPSLAVTMFTGGFLLHNIAIDQRIIFRGFLKKSDAPIGQPKWLVECAEQNANLRKLTMDQQHFFRFKDRAFQEEFQAYIEDRSLLYVRLSLFMLAMTNIVMPLRIPFFPKDSEHVPRFGRIVTFGLYWLLALGASLCSKLKRYQSIISFIGCFINLLYEFYNFYWMGIEDSDKYILLIWRMLDVSATSLCMDLRHVLALYVSSAILFIAYYFMGQGYITDSSNLLLLLSLLYIGWQVCVYRNISTKISYFFRHSESALNAVGS